MGKPKAKNVLRSKPEPKKCPSGENDPNYTDLEIDDNVTNIYDDLDAFIENSYSPWREIVDVREGKAKQGNSTENKFLCRNDKKVRPYHRYKKAVVKFANDTGFTADKILSIFKHKLIKHKCTISQWKRSLQDTEFGNKWDRFNTLERLLYEQYVDLRKNFQTLNEHDFINLALRTHERLVGDNSSAKFQASRAWFHQFILRHRLTSRAITKNRTRVQIEAAENRATILKEFILKIRNNIKIYGAGNVWNADESGFKYETSAKKTYDDVGRKVIFGFTEQEQWTRYNHTIFPVISAGGKLMSKMLIVLREPKYESKNKGKNPKIAEFGPLKEKGLFRSPNLYIRATTRGYTNTDIINDWFNKVYLPLAGTKSCLMLDSAPTRQRPTLLAAVERYKEIDPDKHVELETIPPRETGTLQPCDQYLFRAWKHFYQTIQHQWRKTKNEFRAFTRNNVLKVQAYIHNQFSAKAWEPAINKSWADCCYVMRTADRYDQISDYCINLPMKDTNRTCDYKGACKRKFFIKCLRCEKNLCFVHWLFLDDTKYAIPIHYHNEDGTENEDPPNSNTQNTQDNIENIVDPSEEIHFEDEVDNREEFDYEINDEYDEEND
ncbi:uncharacterized protein MD21A_iyMicDemo21aOGSv2.0-000273 [Microplitis demolitor]